MFADASEKYARYLRFYIKNSEIIHAPISDQIDNQQLLINLKRLQKFCFTIFEILKDSDFCLKTRLMANVIKLLLMDLMVIYSVFHNHIVKMLDRLVLLEMEQLQTTWDSYKNFIRLTYQFRTRVKKLIITQDYQIQLPELYDPD